MAKLTPEQAKALLDSLFAMPDKPKPAAKPKSAPATPAAKSPVPAPASTPVQRNPHFIPTLSIVEVRHQRCTTCGSTHSHISSRRVRFEARRAPTLHTAIEIPTIVPETLPRRVDHIYEDTDICPTCLMVSEGIENILVTTEQAGTQLELFHG